MLHYLNDVCMATSHLWATPVLPLNGKKGDPVSAFEHVSPASLQHTDTEHTDKASDRAIHFSTLRVLDLVCLTWRWGWCARAFRRGDIPESLQGHCLLLYVTLHPSGHLWEGEDSRTHRVKRLQNKLSGYIYRILLMSLFCLACWVFRQLR